MKYTGGISIIIPIYNEEALLKREIEFLIQRLGDVYIYEIILIENGSKDRSYQIAQNLAKKFKVVHTVKENIPSYGTAVKRGLLSARYDTIIQFDLDLIDLDFLKKSLSLLHRADVVVGSKTLSSSSDKRSFARMFVTRSINYVLRNYFRYKGTDTHGIKAYRKKSIIPLLASVINTNLFFDTEVLLLAQKFNLKICELPISVAKLRPTRFTMHIVMFQSFFEFMSLFMRRSYYLSQPKPSITVDDYGLNTQVNATVNTLVKNSSIDTISVLPPLHKKIPSFKGRVACHINLIEGKPILDPSLIPSLVDSRGHFYSFAIFYLKLLCNQISFIELTKEIEAQIKSIAKINNVSELNSHQHTHALYPIDQIVAVFAKKNSVYTIRVYGNIHHFSLRGYFFKFFFQFLVLIEHSVYGKILSQSPSWKKREKPISFMSWETTIQPSPISYELVCHPGTLYDKNTMYTSILK